VPITDRLRLQADVTLTPVEELPSRIRERLTYDRGDFAITRRRARAPTRVVGGDAAALLQGFLQPSTVASAVIHYAQERGISAVATLDASWQMIERLFDGGMLVEEGSADAKPLASFRRGERVGKWTIVETLQLLDDVEVHQATHGARVAILKIEGPDPPSVATATAALEREGRVLDELAGTIAPAFFENGECRKRRFIAIEWCTGIRADTYAAELRDENDRDALLRLFRAIVAAYARLHSLGFVHGDVHSRNVLVGAAGEVRLIDFGAASPIEPRSGAPSAPGRTGVGFFYEPEFAAAALAGSIPPCASPASEQYSVAALLYSLATGVAYLDFSLERTTMLRQIVDEAPRRFAARGVSPWLKLEAILARALSKETARRFPSMDAMATALATVSSPKTTRKREPSLANARALLDTVCAELDNGAGTTHIEPPTASLFFGAAGIACALYRLAILTDDPARLAAADVWLSHAQAGADSPNAFSNPEKGLTAETVGTNAPLHTASGLAALRALIAHAQGYDEMANRAAARFTHLSFGGPKAESRELALGRSGVLLAAALVGSALPRTAPARAELVRRGGETLDSLWNELAALPALARQAKAPNLGMAHGWCGYLYAALRFCRAFGHPLPAGLHRRCSELAGLAEPWERGLRWPWNDRGLDVGTMPGWCNGSAGFVQLFALAHDEFDDAPFLETAIGAAWHAWDAGDGNGTLCCGEAGRAYALAALARHLNDDAAWLARATRLADRAAVAIARTPKRPYSLFKGRIGVALLAADLAHPQACAFPFFEDEGWI
jgi:serine/threonine-protein kinase